MPSIFSMKHLQVLWWAVISRRRRILHLMSIMKTPIDTHTGRPLTFSHQIPNKLCWHTTCITFIFRLQYSKRIFEYKYSANMWRPPIRNRRLTYSNYLNCFNVKFLTFWGSANCCEEFDCVEYFEWNKWKIRSFFFIFAYSCERKR